MRILIFATALLCSFHSFRTAEIRLLDLEPTDAQQYIEKQDTSLKYAPKIESNVPAVRFIGDHPENVVEDIYLANQYHGQDGLGGYLYGYAVPDIAKTEKKVAGGDLTGSYNYIAGDGQEIKVEYWDKGDGFHQIDNVPKILPKQVEDSPDVKAAKEEHFRIWHEEAERNSHPIASPYNNEGSYAQGPLSQQGQAQRQQQFAQQPNQYKQQSAGQYQQPTSQYQQQSTGQYKQQSAGQYQPQPAGQYQQQSTGHYQQQPIGQYKQQSAGQYQQQPTGQHQQQAAGQYQHSAAQASGQYQQTVAQQPIGNQFGQQTGQHQQGQYKSSSSLNQVDYNGQYSENKDTYSQTQQQKQEEDEEEKGPPRGFFYNFDYPVGIIVQKPGDHSAIKREGDVKDVYASNKALFEKQLHAGSGSSAGSSAGYLLVH